MELSRDLPLVAGLLAAILAAIFLASAETALLRLPSVRVKSLAAGDRRGRILADLVERLPAVLNAVLLGALLAQIAAATLTGLLAERWFGNVGVTLASIALTIFLFIYGEAIPKTFAIRYPERVGLWVAMPLRFVEVALRPVVALLVRIADLQMPGRGITTAPTITEAELLELATRAATEGEITADDRQLIERAFRVGDRQVDDIMVPRPDIVAVEADLEIEAALGSALKHGHRRLPVYDGTIDNIVGMVRLRDLVNRRDQGGIVREITTPILEAPRSKPILDLLQEMQEQRIHMAVVVDEHGGTAGIATIEDIVEELLGSVTEEVEEEPVRRTADGWSIAGSLPVEDLAALVGDLPEGDWNTAAGMVMGLIGRVPRLGDTVRVDGAEIRVTGLRRRRITRLDVVPVKAQDSPAES